MDLVHDLLNLATWYVVFVFSTTCHEAAHAWVAYMGGDSTAYEGGQVTLDPAPHIKREPLGMVIFPLATSLLSGGTSMFGFASAPFDPHWAQRHPKKYSLMSLAGPLANFTLALIAVLLMYAGVQAGLFVPSPRLATDELVLGAGSWALAGKMLSILFFLNALLGLFNLLPIPPLDGAGALEGAFPDSIGRVYQRIRGHSVAGLIGFLLILNFGGRLIEAPLVRLLLAARAFLFS